MNEEILREIADKKTKVVDGKVVVFKTMTSAFEKLINEDNTLSYIVNNAKGNYCYVQSELDAALSYMPYADVYELHVDGIDLIDPPNNDGRVVIIKNDSKVIIGDIITSDEKFDYFVNGYNEKGKSR